MYLTQVAFLALPNGCGDVNGPYSLKCLLSIWRDAGCLKEGYGSPTNLTSDELKQLNNLALQ